MASKSKARKANHSVWKAGSVTHVVVRHHKKQVYCHSREDMAKAHAERCNILARITQSPADAHVVKFEDRPKGYQLIDHMSGLEIQFKE